MFSRTIQGRDYYAYSFHRTYDAACEALDEYFATGEICEAEQPQLFQTDYRTCTNPRIHWAVMFPM